MEIWKDIKGYENLYQISNLGNIRSFYNNAHGLKYIPNKKTLSINTHGYYTVCLVKDKKAIRINVHKLMAITFLNHIPNKYNIVIDHINTIKTDNRLENLQLITQRENLSKDKKNKSSKYTGVSFKKQTNKWQSQIFIKGKLVHLGYFFNELDAHKAYQNKLLLL